MVYALLSHSITQIAITAHSITERNTFLDDFISKSGDNMNRKIRLLGVQVVRMHSYYLKKSVVSDISSPIATKLT